MRWFRFYDDAINDPKILKLSEASRWHWTALLCIASKHDGVLPPTEDVALMLRVKTAAAAAIIATMKAAGLLDVVDGRFSPHNWNGRQYKSDVSTDRVKRFRKRERNVSETPPETEADTEQKQSRTDTLPAVAARVVDPPVSKKRSSRLPDDWQPSERAYVIAEQFGQNVQIVEGIFRDYCASSGKLYADHDAAFHNFIRNQKTFNRGSGDAKPKNGIIQAADDLRRKIASFDGPSGSVEELCGGEGAYPPRLLSNG